MATVTILDSIRDFLKDNVCSSIKLKKPNNNNADEFELVSPGAYSMYMPPKGYIPAGLKSAIPCLVVCFDDALDDGIKANLNIRINMAVYNPGEHLSGDNGSVQCVPDYEGWRDLLNFMDLTLAEIIKNQILNGVTIEYPIKWGVYLPDDQVTELTPYFYGWITFTAKKQGYQPALIAEKYL